MGGQCVVLLKGDCPRKKVVIIEGDGLIIPIAGGSLRQYSRTFDEKNHWQVGMLRDLFLRDDNVDQKLCIRVLKTTVGSLI